MVSPRDPGRPHARTTTRRSIGIDVTHRRRRRSRAAASAACGSAGDGRSSVERRPRQAAARADRDADDARDVRRADDRRHDAHVHRGVTYQWLATAGKFSSGRHRRRPRSVRQPDAGAHGVDRAGRPKDLDASATSRCGSSSATSASACTWYESCVRRRAVIDRGMRTLLVVVAVSDECDRSRAATSTARSSIVVVNDALPRDPRLLRDVAEGEPVAARQGHRHVHDREGRQGQRREGGRGIE